MMTSRIFKRCIKLSQYQIISKCKYSRHEGKLQKWSYCHGPSETPLLGVTVGQALQQRAEIEPDTEALVFSTDKVRKTFSQLLEEADAFAAGLLELGLKKGDRVGMWGPNSYEWILTQYATARAGIILVNINPLYRPNELEYSLKKVGCKAVVMGEEFKGQNYHDMMFHLVPELARTKKGQQIDSHILPELKHLIIISEKDYDGMLKFSDVLGSGTSKRRSEILNMQNKLQFDDPINIQFTSGTTGFPKGATLSHHNIVNNSFFVGKTLGYDDMDTRICVPVPLYHCFGMVIGSLQMVTHGATCIFPSPGFDAGLALKAVHDERCTSLYGVPTMFIDMLNHPEFSSFDLSELYTGVMAGSPCPIETMRQVITEMEMPAITVCYGTTENSPVTFQSHRDDVITKKVSTVGQPHPHVEAKVIDENGNLLPVGESGELCTRGYMTMLEYWGDPTRTRDVIKPDRWYHTGTNVIRIPAVIMESKHPNLRPRNDKNWKKLCYGEKLPRLQKERVVPRKVVLEESYKIERLLVKKETPGKGTEFLVKWYEYPATDSTWEPKSHIDQESHRNYYPDEINYFRLQSAAIEFESAIQRRLKRGNRNNLAVIRFESDIFRYCFQTDKSLLINSVDDLRRLPLDENWNIRLDSMGAGQQIKFPMRLNPRVCMEKVFYRSNDNTVNFKLKPVETVRISTATCNSLV